MILSLFVGSSRSPGLTLFYRRRLFFQNENARLFSKPYRSVSVSTCQFSYTLHTQCLANHSNYRLDPFYYLPYTNRAPWYSNF